MKKIFIWVLLFVLILIILSLILKRKIIEREVYEPAVTAAHPYDLTGEFIFNNPGATTEFSQLFLDTLKSAHTSIDLAIYSLSDPDIVAILDQKEREGVDVHVIVPTSKGNQHQLTFALSDITPQEIGRVTQGSEAGDNEMNGELMHHKFILIDKDTDNRQLIVSSANLTAIQQQFDPSFAFTTRDPAVIDQFSHEFHLLKGNTHGLKKLTSGDYHPFQYQGSYTNGDFNIWFGPGYLKNSIKYRILEQIESAQDHIRIIGWRINDRDIAQALMRKAREGVKVSIIADDYYLWDGTSSLEMLTDIPNINLVSDSYMYFVLKGNELLSDAPVREDFNSFLHHHTLIIDNTYLLTGTNNWTQGGFYYNDESMIETTIPSFIQTYTEQFTYLHNLLEAESLNYELTPERYLTLDLKHPATILVYQEKSNPDWVGELCIRTAYEANTPLLIPPSCMTDHTRIFVVGENNILMQSAYLKQS